MHGGLGGHGGHAGNGAGAFGGHHGVIGPSPAHHTSGSYPGHHAGSHAGAAAHVPGQHGQQGVLAHIAHFFDAKGHHQHHGVTTHEPSDSLMWNQAWQLEKPSGFPQISQHTKLALVAFASFGLLVGWLFVIHALRVNETHHPFAPTAGQNGSSYGSPVPQAPAAMPFASAPALPQAMAAVPFASAPAVPQAPAASFGSPRINGDNSGVQLVHFTSSNALPIAAAPLASQMPAPGIAIPPPGLLTTPANQRVSYAHYYANVGPIKPDGFSPSRLKMIVGR